MPRKSAQDKAFDKTLGLLPALSNEDLAVIVVACNNIVQARERVKRMALRPRIPLATATPPHEERIASQSETPPHGAGDGESGVATHVEENDKPATLQGEI